MDIRMENTKGMDLKSLLSRQNHKTGELRYYGRSWILKSLHLIEWTILVIFILCQTVDGHNTDNIDAQYSQYSMLDVQVQLNNSNDSSEVTTTSWLQLMEEDEYRNVSSDQQTTISWLQFMEIDSKDLDEGAELSRLKRDTDGSGSGMTEEPTTTVAEDTTTIVVDEDTTTAMPNSETSAVTTEDMGSGEFLTTAEVTTTLADMNTTSVSDNTATTEVTTATEETTTATNTQSTATEEVGSGEISTTPEVTASVSTAVTEEFGSGDTSTTVAETTQTAVTAQPCGGSCPENQFCASIDGQDTCSCNAGFFYNNATDTCEEVKTFGGILHVDATFNDSLSDPTDPYYQYLKNAYTQQLRDIYGSEPWFKDVVVTGFAEGSIEVNHLIYTTTDDSVDETTVQGVFETYLSSQNCSCDETTCDPSPTDIAGPIEGTASCADAGTASTVVCDDAVISQYCNSDANATCSANATGDVFCECQQNYVFQENSLTSCTAIVCSAGFGCNEPLGSCNTDTPQGTCYCIGGVQGKNCQIVWGFALIISASCAVFIAIIVVIIVLCRRKGRSKTGKISKSNPRNPYVNSGALSVSGERFKSMEFWEEGIGGVVPTSYKNISESEIYDSAYDRPSMSGDTDQDSDNQGVTIRNWRVREIGEGERVSIENQDSQSGSEREAIHLGTFYANDDTVMEQTKI